MKRPTLKVDFKYRFGIYCFTISSTENSTTLNKISRWTIKTDELLFIDDNPKYAIVYRDVNSYHVPNWKSTISGLKEKILSNVPEELVTKANEIFDTFIFKIDVISKGKLIDFYVQTINEPAAVFLTSIFIDYRFKPTIFKKNKKGENINYKKGEKVIRGKEDDFIVWPSFTKHFDETKTIYVSFKGDIDKKYVAEVIKNIMIAEYLTFRKIKPYFYGEKKYIKIVARKNELEKLFEYIIKNSENSNNHRIYTDYAPCDHCGYKITDETTHKQEQCYKNEPLYEN